uniref:ShKT domain-containing protein n=1 Tax=Panagrolaimus sp. JU765 TaxID=591449 RepID=A0AC34Q7A1_9BILA
SRYERENAFPLDSQQCASANHFGSALMRPFEPWRNTDGLNNQYTDNMFVYAPRPTCSMVTECGSKYLFCDRSHGAPRCASKLRIGAMCGGYASENPCYNGVCQSGVCVAMANIPVTTRPPPVFTTLPPAAQPQNQNCYNEHECCGTWQAKGECARNPGYMNAWCKASCGQCRPNYDLRRECADRHPNCVRWSRAGECTRNPYWMTENCRQSCNKCGRSRAQVCGGGAQQQQQPQRPGPARPAKCDSPGCFNENICCQFWGIQGQCNRNATWMACNCKVSCGYCIPQDYYYGTCDDYHNDCPQWAQRGECQKNPWMLENCKFSCQTCLTNFELRQMCGGGRGGRFGRDVAADKNLDFSFFSMKDGFGMPAPDLM